MSTVSTWGLCPSQVEVALSAPSESSARETGFLSGRLYTARTPRRFTLRYDDVPPVWWDEVMQVYGDTYGGALRVAYTPPGGSQTEVRFASTPQSMTKRTGNAVSFEVIFDEVVV